MIDQSDLNFLAEQIYDLHINPMADVIVRLLHMLVQKDVLEKSEAMLCVAEAVKVIGPLSYSEAAKESAATTLKRMLDVLESNN